MKKQTKKHKHFVTIQLTKASSLTKMSILPFKPVNSVCIIDLTKTSVLREMAGLSCLKEINI